ncbi:MAG: hypothetical protein M3Y22_18565 [Pseudomonadota bacterium]|nr:hypothetical protein [Pseudomonadota bacterium]
MWFVLWIFVIFLLFSGGGYYGHRRSYYGQSSAFGLIAMVFIVFWIAILWGGPHYGYYNSWW